jgi:hypothetical protein
VNRRQGLVLSVYFLLLALTAVEWFSAIESSSLYLTGGLGIIFFLFLFVVPLLVGSRLRKWAKSGA